MNHWALTFLQCVDYSRFDEITVEIELAAGASIAAIEAKLDTGSKFCVFQPDHARLLGIDLVSGIPERIRTATGSFPAYGHEVTLHAGDLQWDSIVYFAEPEDFPLNVVGRIGFLNQITQHWYRESNRRRTPQERRERSELVFPLRTCGVLRRWVVPIFAVPI